MKKVVTYEGVAFACAKLMEDGEKITGRAVLEMTGGSFGTVLQYLKQWKEQGGSEVALPTQIPDSLTKEIMQALWQSSKDGKDFAESQIIRLTDSENEAVNALCVSEVNVARLEETLEDCREEQRVKLEECREDHRAKLQQSETQVALLSEKLSMANREAERVKVDNDDKSKQISGLQVKNAELVQMVSSAEKSLIKSEAGLEVMQEKIDQLIARNICLEKEKAIAEQKLQNSGQMCTESIGCGVG